MTEPTEHGSDCAVHNEPAMPAGPCNCGGLPAEPDNETLRKIGAFDRKTRVGKHQATNWAHLRQTIDTLDAAGHSDAADTLIWTVWHEVSGVARAREYHRLALQDLEHKTGSLRTEIGAKVAAYREIKALEDGIRDVIAICEQDARDQDHNARTTGFGPGSKAYAEGRGTACRGIAARLKALLADPLPAPATPQEETP